MMELTDRRKRISNSNSFDQSTQKENRWCKNYATDSPPSSAGDGTARVNDDRDRHWFGWRRIRRTQVLVWIIIAISFLHLRSLVPSEDSVQKIEDNTTKIKHDSSSSVGKSEPTTPPSIKKRTKPTRRPTTPGTDKSSPVDDSISEVAPPQTETIEEVKEEKEEKKKPPIISDSNDKKSEQKSGNHRDKKSKKSSKDKATTTKPSPLPSLSPAQTQSDGGTKSEKPKATVSDSNAKNKKGGEDTESPVESPKNNDNNPVPKATKSTKDSTSNNAQTNDKLDGGGGGITTGSESRTSKTINQGVAHSWSSNLQNPRSDADLSETASKFLETHCDLTNVKDGQWYPSGEESDWKQRAPYLIVAGVWNAGVNPLANALLKHPQIEFAKQNGFFLPKQFKRYLDVQPSGGSTSNNVTAVATKFNVKVFAARERMYAQVYSKSSFREKIGAGDQDSPTTSDNKHVAMDVSPGLVFYAHQTAHSILCTTPWVKIVVVLRNPIDRLYQQWVYSTMHLGLTLSLEEWMAQEMKLLQTVGLISDAGGSEGADQSKEVETKAAISEKEAWNQYQSVHKMAGAIGRSLYVFQLEQWIDAYVAAGKNPSEEIIVLTTEDIENDPAQQYGDLIRFLGLPPLDGAGAGVDDGVATTLQNALLQRKNTPLPPMEEETRKMLKRFFKPYNKRLADLLRSNGFEGEWVKLWKK